MRRYDIVFGILFILSIIDFALAAPLLVQEKRHPCVDAVHIPKDVKTVFGKRDEDLERLAKMAQEYIKTHLKQVESSDAHAPPSSAPPGPESPPDHGSMNDVQAPASNPGPSKEPEFDWDYWMSLDDSPPLRPASPNEFGQAHKNQVEHVQQSDSETGWSLDDMDEWFDSDSNSDAESSPKRRKPASSKEFGQAEYQVVHVQQPNPPSNLRLPTEPGYDVAPVTAIAPSPNLGSPEDSEFDSDYDIYEVPPTSPDLTDPELHLDHQSDSQPVDLLAAIYAAKGKAKESRRIHGTARDAGNAAQRGLQLAERSLDPGNLTVRNPGEF